MEALLRDPIKLPAEALAQEVIQAVEVFAGNGTFADDLTMMLVKIR